MYNILLNTHVILCFCIIVMCICRAGTKMNKDTKTAIALQPPLWALAASLLLFFPFSGISIIMSAIIFYHLASGIPAWKNRAPKYSFKHPSTFGNDRRAGDK